MRNVFSLFNWIFLVQKEIFVVQINMASIKWNFMVDFISQYNKLFFILF